MKEFSDDYEVCECKSITIGEIRTAIKDHNITSVKEIAEWTYAGDACGSCKSKEDDDLEEKEIYLKDILDKF